MEVKEFIKANLAHALGTEKKTGINAIFTLADAALESGWGKFAPGNMFFGVKDTDGINGNEQLITTTEYSRRSDLKFPVVLHIEPVMMNGLKYFKYTVKDYFRSYDSPEACFNDHAQFFLKNKRYAKALLVKQDPIAFAQAIAKAGYATGPDYAKTLIAVIKTIQRNL
jgi:flagellum-specific peptidoglycan hydrolase FlgJ